MDVHVFADRTDAGRRLGRFVKEQLANRQVGGRPLVLALPRGGVEVGAHVAEAVGAELDVVVARKIGAPDHPELAIGAVTATGPVYWNRRVLDHLLLRPGDVEDLVHDERAEAARRVYRYRGEHPSPVTGRTVIVVDDGLATGATAAAALRQVRTRRPGQLILAVPVGARDTVTALEPEADEVWALLSPAQLMSISEWYADFPQLTDDDVEAILHGHRAAASSRR